MSRLTPDVGVDVQLLDGTRVSGKLRVLSPGVNDQTRNGIAYVALPKHSGAAPGMYLSGRFTLATRKALTLPESAIVLRDRSEEHTAELQTLMRIWYAVFCLKKKKKRT